MLFRKKFPDPTAAAEVAIEAEATPSPVDVARAKVDQAEGQLARAREAAAEAESALSSPCDATDVDAYRFEMARRREACTEAGDAVSFFAKHLAVAKQAHEPLDKAGLEDGVKNGRYAARLAADTLPIGVGELVSVATHEGRSLASAFTLIAESYALAEADAFALFEKYGVRVEPLIKTDPELHALVQLAPATKTPAGWLRCAAAVIEFMDAAPVREAERKRSAEERAAAKARRYREDAARGTYGPEERDRVLAEVRQEYRQTQTRGGALVADVKGTFAQAEVEVARVGLPRSS